MEITLKVVKTITDKVYKDKKGVERNFTNYYLVIGEQWIAIRPSFAKGYMALDTIATTIDKRNQF